jgi:hypothetical protein
MQIVFGNATMSHVLVFECIHHFEEGQISVKNDEHPGHHLTSENKLVAEAHNLV